MENQLQQSGLHNIPSNLLTLRRRLKLSQKEFIQAYLCGEEGPLISVATLSNVERGSTANVERLTQRLADSMGVSGELFQMDPDAFAKNVDLFFENQLHREHPLGEQFQRRGAGNADILVQAISDYLMDGMISGRLKPGDMIPSDRQLSELFGVGRSAVREALKVLNVLGLIHIFPGRGSFIASESTDLFFAPLSWTFLLGERNIRHLIDVRNVLEHESARLAALQARPEHLAELENVFRRTTAAYESSDFQAFLGLDVDFHLAVAKCSCNPIILNLLITSRKVLSYISESGMKTISHLDAIYKEHEAIFHAIVEGRSDDALAAMAHHLEVAMTRYQF